MRKTLSLPPASGRIKQEWVSQPLCPQPLSLRASARSPTAPRTAHTGQGERQLPPSPASVCTGEKGCSAANSTHGLGDFHTAPARLLLPPHKTPTPSRGTRLTTSRHVALRLKPAVQPQPQSGRTPKGRKSLRNPDSLSAAVTEAAPSSPAVEGAGKKPPTPRNLSPKPRGGTVTLNTQQPPKHRSKPPRAYTRPLRHTSPKLCCWKRFRGREELLPFSRCLFLSPFLSFPCKKASCSGGGEAQGAVPEPRRPALQSLSPGAGG